MAIRGTAAFGTSTLMSSFSLRRFDTDDSLCPYQLSCFWDYLNNANLLLLRFPFPILQLRQCCLPP